MIKSDVCFHLDRILEKNEQMRVFRLSMDERLALKEVLKILSPKGEKIMNENKNNSKTLKEIFEEKYPPKKVAQNVCFALEAYGYLKALENFSTDKWIKKYEEALLLDIMCANLINTLEN